MGPPGLEPVRGGRQLWVADATQHLVCWWYKAFEGPSGTDYHERSYRYIAMRARQLCGITTDEQAVCWDERYEWNPAPMARFVSVVPDSRVGCGLDAAGLISCWGLDLTPDHDFGSEVFVQISSRLGLMALTPSGEVVTRPSTVLRRPPPARSFAEISNGDGSQCGIDGSGQATCWSMVDENGNWDAPPGKYLMTAAGMHDGSAKSYNCAIRDDLKVVCWGSLAAEEPPPDGQFLEISVSRNEGCGIRTDGGVVCWRGNGKDEDLSALRAWTD
ncbi:MAG: hypothetical protein OEZ06_15345 [Myxococcales bacterium]|nr:hypothetical protein [Myxococcales bacterium]